MGQPMTMNVGVESFQRPFAEARRSRAYPICGLLGWNKSHIPFRQYRTEAAGAGAREVVVLMSGAWKT